MADATLESTKPTGGLLMAVLKAVGPALFAVVVGYGGVRYAEGQTHQRLKTVEAQQQEQKSVNDKLITRDEFKQFMEATREDLREIKQDVRAIRSDLQRK